MDSRVYDIIIIGGGPAGLTAGIYAARANMRTLLLESAFQPSLITITNEVENYPGFPEGITGPELVERLAEQARRFGLEIEQADVTSLTRGPGQDTPNWRVSAGQDDYETLAVIVATGADHARLGVPGEEEFGGRGVSYCATCDGPFFRDSELVVVGGGDTAVQEALFLTKFARKVTLVHRRDRLRAAGVLKDRAQVNPKIAFAWNAVVEEIQGTTAVTGVRLKDVSTGQIRQLACEGVFVFTGYVPHTELLQGLARMDTQGYLIVDDHMQTSVPGIFACGDCTRKLLRQVVTACGDGATAAFAAGLYVDGLKGQSYDSPNNNISE